MFCHLLSDIMAITHTFLRRGLEAASDAISRPKDGNGDGDETRINPFALLVIAVTVLFFGVVMIAVSSTLGAYCFVS